MGKEKGSVVDQVYSYVFHKIQSREYAPGARINIEELSREFGVSRTPVREALSKLIQDGFIEQRYNAGVRVVEFTTDDMFETIEANTKLFGILFDEFQEKGISPEMLQELQEIFNIQVQADKKEDLEAFHSASVEFHHCIIKYGYNHILQSYLSTTQKRINLSTLIYQLELSHRQRSLEEHGKILEQLQAGEIGLAKQSMEQHNLYPMNVLHQVAKRNSI
jgi:DNA-binding GntR family transcriptional regulator